MKLKKVKSIELIPASPFNFDATFHKPDHFTSGDNFWKPGIRWQTMIWSSKPDGLKEKTRRVEKGKQLGLKFKNAGAVGRPKVIVDIYCKERLSEEFTNSLIDEIKYRFNFDLDLKPFYKKFQKDKVLGPIIKKWAGLRPGHPSSLYEYLIIGIVLQNATVKRSVQMFQALLTNYGKLLEYNRKNLPRRFKAGLWNFWEPGGLTKVTEDQLRALKVGYRAKSIKRIDGYFAKGLINEFDLRNKDRETQKEELLKLYGVGPATVWYLMFDVFHHWDFFEHISPWEQKIYSKVFFNRGPENPVSVKKLLKYIDKYGEYKHLAVHYIWEDLWWSREIRRLADQHDASRLSNLSIDITRWKRENQRIDWLEKLIRL